MGFWQIMYLVALAVLAYAIVLQPLLEWVRRCVARRWIRRAMKILEFNISIGSHETQCLCGVFQDTRPSGIIFLWGCSYGTVLHNVIGLDYYRLAEHYGTTRAKREGMFSTKLKEIGSGFIGQCAWWNTGYPEGNEIRLRVLRDLELHCDGGFKNGTGLD